MFNICALRNVYTYVTNQQTHTDKIYFIIYYYSSKYFGRFCDHYQDVTQEYKKYTTIAHHVQLKSPDVPVNMLSSPVVIKLQIMLSLKTDKIGCVYVAS
jgi:hypothetical protein